MVEIKPENVAEDRELTQAEKETTIRFDKTTDKAVVFSSEGGIMRRLIQHPLFEITDVTEKDGNIVGLVGKCPIAALSFGSSERNQKGHANLVTNSVMNTGDNATVNV